MTQTQYLLLIGQCAVCVDKHRKGMKPVDCICVSSAVKTKDVCVDSSSTVDPVNSAEVVTSFIHEDDQVSADSTVSFFCLTLFTCSVTQNNYKVQMTKNSIAG